MKLDMFDDLLNSLGGLDAKAMIEMLTPKFKFALREDLKDMKQFLPTRTTDRSSGWDISCAWDDHKDHTVQPGEFVKIPLGIRCIPDEGYWYEVKPRSSTLSNWQSSLTRWNTRSTSYMAVLVPWIAHSKV